MEWTRGAAAASIARSGTTRTATARRSGCPFNRTWGIKMADSMDYKCGCNYSTRLRHALVEVRALVSEQECRGDEDCDHCLILHGVIDRAFAWPEEEKLAEPEPTKSGGVLRSDNGGYTASCPICREWASKAEPCDHNYTEKPFVSRETTECVCELRHRQFNPHTGRCETCGLRRHMPSGLKTGDENFKPATCQHTHRQAVQSDGGCVQCIPEETAPKVQTHYEATLNCPACRGSGEGHTCAPISAMPQESIAVPSKCDVPQETAPDNKWTFAKHDPTGDGFCKNCGQIMSEITGLPCKLVPQEPKPQLSKTEQGLCWQGGCEKSAGHTGQHGPVKPPRQPCTKLPDCPCSRCETIKGLSEAYDRSRGKKT